MQSSSGDEPSSANTSQKHRTSSSSPWSSNTFLDFLYPAKTLALIQRLANTNATYLRTRAQFISSPYAVRAFTSRSSLSQEIENGNSTLVDTQLTLASANEEPQTRTAKFTQSRELETEYTKAWERYQELEHQSSGESAGSVDELSSLVNYIRARGAALKAERAARVLSLFNKLDVDNRRSIHYDYAVQAALHLDDLEHATALHQEAVVRLQGSFGTACILRYTVEHENWPVAIRTWDEYWQHRKMYYGRPDIWNGVDSLELDVLVEKSLALSQWALQTTESIGWDASKIIRDFSLQLILRTFSTRGTPGDLQKYGDLFEKLKELTGSLDEYYNAAIHQLLSAGSDDHGKLALKLYREMREDSSIVPPQHLLEKIIQKMRVVQSRDLLMAYEDFVRYHNNPTKRALSETIHGMTSDGNAEVVHALFDKYQELFGNPTKPYLYASLLRVHMRRGEIDEALKIFNSLHQKYNFEPTIGCWNMVLATYARVNDIEGAKGWWEKMLASNEQPNQSSFAIMASVYGNQGDVDAVQSLLRQCEEQSIETTVFIVEQLALAHIRNNELGEAENLVRNTWERKLPGKHTSLWNLMINAYGLRNNLEKVNELVQYMYRAPVPRDGETFSALMQSLCVAKQPLAADKVLTIIMPRERVRVTSLHYSIVMQGYLTTREPKEAMRLYGRMLKRKVKSNFNSHQALLKAAAQLELEARKKKGRSGSPVVLELAEEFLDQLIETMDPADIAQRGPLKGIQDERLDEAHVSSYFEYLINMYGKARSFEKVSRLFDKYITTSQKVRPAIEVSPPLRMLSALMTVHLRRRDYDEVERCWYLAQAKAEPLARRVTATNLLESGWVLPAKRTILNTPLSHYIRALVAQNRLPDIESVIEQLQVWGYEPDSRAWNLLVQGLVSAGETIKAINICEEKLIQNFSWRNASGVISIHSIPRLSKAQPKAWERTKLIPNYKTMTMLASAYLRLRTERAFAGPADTVLADLDSSAPETVGAIMETPRRNDSLQQKYLQRI